MSREVLLGKNDVATIWELPDGGIRAEGLFATTIMYPDGNMKTTLKVYKKINIDNISDIVSYNIKKKEDIMIHEITFNDGGTIIIWFDPSSEIPDFESTGIALSVSSEGVITISKNQKGEGNK